MDDAQALLDDLADAHRVPGAQLAVLDGDHLTLARSGVTSRETAVRVTTDTLFQIGSVTKLYTASQVMQLVDEGAVELDSPVRRYLPEFGVADPAASDAVTVRQLLSHTAGFDGDHFVDTGRGDDCLERYVASCASLPQLFPPGTRFSYCNGGFVILGRLVERVTGQTWDTALRQRLLDPLGAARTVTLPEEAIVHRVAVGHIADRDQRGRVRPARRWMLWRSEGPAGLICSTAADLVTFARLHLDGGNVGRTRVLSEESVAAMQEPQVELPEPFTLGQACGLGWFVSEWDGERVLTHDGTTIGQMAFLVLVPGRRLAVALLTNGMNGRKLRRDLFGRLLADAAGLTAPEPPSPTPGVDEDLAPYGGTYDRLSARTEVSVRDGRLVAAITRTGAMVDLAPPATDLHLRPVGPRTFVVRLPFVDEDALVTFLDPGADGRPRYLHMVGMASRRVDPL